MSKKLTTEEVREYFAYVHDVYEHLSGPSEERAQAFDAWLEGERTDARLNLLNHLAGSRIIAPSKRDEMVACPADCGMGHVHVARMGGDPDYWSGK